MPLIFDIKRFSINDGPGIRTTVFLKGCPLHCLWCHNPEGISDHSTRLYNKKKCIGCRSCVEACPQGVLSLTQDGIKLASDSLRQKAPTGLPNDIRGLSEAEPSERSATNDGCLLCGRCADACPSKAMEMGGREWTVEELMRVIEKERQVMTDSGGGVTLCGGEPLLHPDYLIDILRAVGSAGFHRAVDTSLFASRETVERVMEECELLLIDLKHFDDEAHHRYTGVGNKLILENIRLVSEAQKAYWIRIPLIVGVNADEDNLRKSAEFLASLPTKPEAVCLLPYHDIGKGKHARMGTTYNPEALPMRQPTPEEQEHALSLFTAQGLNTRIGG